MHHRPHGDHACASCKHQRKKCKEDCTMAPFFPVQSSKQFRAVHKIFGVSNVAKQLKKHSQEEHRRMSADSLIWEAGCWENDPVQGPYGLYKRAVEELTHYKNQYYGLASTLPANSAMNLAAYNPPPPNSAAMNGWNQASPPPPTNINGGGSGGSILSSVTHDYGYTNNNNGVVQDLDLEHIATPPEQEIQRIGQNFQGQRDHHHPNGVITGIFNGVIMPQRQLQLQNHHLHNNSVATFQQLFAAGQYHTTSEGNPAGNIAGDVDSSGWTGNSQ